MSDTELDVVAEEEAPELTEEEIAEASRLEFVQSMLDAIAKFPNSPSDNDVLSWKESFGDIYGFGLAEDELFIFRSLTRVEHRAALKKMREAAQAVQDGDAEAMPDEAEEIVTICLLWCSKPASLHRKAGTYETLHQQILSYSNFVDPNIAAQLVFKL